LSVSGPALWKRLFEAVKWLHSSPKFTLAHFENYDLRDHQNPAVPGPVRHLAGTRRDGKPKKPLAVCRNKCCKPHNGTSYDFYAYPTNDDADLSSIAVKGEKTMFDAKYNSLFDSTWFRIAINCALFAVWVGVAVGTLAVR
jgi:hypothetical protein